MGNVGKLFKGICIFIDFCNFCEELENESNDYRYYSAFSLQGTQEDGNILFCDSDSTKHKLSRVY
jgi:hypothetical protein